MRFMETGIIDYIDKKLWCFEDRQFTTAYDNSKVVKPQAFIDRETMKVWRRTIMCRHRERQS